MSTKQIQYKLLREFGENLIREIQVSGDPNEKEVFKKVI